MDTITSNENQVTPIPQGIIVNFPCKSHVECESKVIPSTAPLFARKRVRFSEFSLLVMIPYDDAKSKWYAQREERQFKREMIADVLTFRDLLRRATPALMSEDILFSSVGIENYLSPSLARDAARKKQAHSLVIRLTQINDSDNTFEKLSEISINSSRLARERAEKVAVTRLFFWWGSHFTILSCFYLAVSVVSYSFLCRAVIKSDNRAPRQSNLPTYCNLPDKAYRKPSSKWRDRHDFRWHRRRRRNGTL